MAVARPSAFRSFLALAIYSIVAAAAAYRAAPDLGSRIALLTGLTVLLYGAHRLVVSSRLDTARSCVESVERRVSELEGLRHAALGYIAQITAELSTIDPDKDKVPLVKRALATLTNGVAEVVDSAIDIVTTYGAVGLELAGIRMESMPMEVTGRALELGKGLSVGRTQVPTTRREQLTDLLQYHRARITELDSQLANENSQLAWSLARVARVELLAVHWRHYRWIVVVGGLVGVWSSVFALVPATSVMR